MEISPSGKLSKTNPLTSRPSAGPKSSLPRWTSRNLPGADPNWTPKKLGIFGIFRKNKNPWAGFRQFFFGGKFGFVWCLKKFLFKKR